MILDHTEKTTVRFCDHNRLVEDAMAQERERKAMHVWSEEEKKIFVEKYLMFPKNFRKIASFMPGKTTADCVSYYYTHKYTLNLKKRLREHQMKRKGMRKVNLVCFICEILNGLITIAREHTCRENYRTSASAALSTGQTQYGLLALEASKKISQLHTRPSLPSWLGNL